MARQLWLLRHAEAEPHGTRPDFERRLTAKGERQARVAGLALARMGVERGTVLCSPKERALRTATIALHAWREQSAGARHHAELTVDQRLQHGFDASGALAALADLGPGGRLLAVGHEPDFSTVVCELTGARIDLKKAGLAVVRLSPGIAREPSTVVDPPAEGAAPATAAGEGAVPPTADPSGESEAAGGAGRRRSEPAGELVLLLRPAELALVAGVPLAEA